MRHLGKHKTEMADFKSYCLGDKDIFLDDVNELILRWAEMYVSVLF